jgi:prepilin-type N-terminal cleavage/methylation domain-containing protein
MRRKNVAQPPSAVQKALSRPRAAVLHSGYSLLEVILALTVLGGALLMVGEGNRLALRNAAAARDTARAQLLGESKMAEIVTGMITPDPVSGVSFDQTTTDALDPTETPWVYSIENVQTDETGLICVRVTVARDETAARSPVRYTLVRWMPDPNATTTGTSATSESSGSSSSTSNATGGGNGG